MLKLKPDEQEMLEGRQGRARQAAMSLLVKYAEGLGAESFVDTNNVTLIAGTLPDIDILRSVVPTLDIDAIASKVYLDSDEVIVVDKVKAFTTANATHRDQRFPALQRGGQEACDLMRDIEGYLKRIGVVNLLTCTPYQSGNAPRKGEHCAWNESSAQAYCNAVLGGRTNIEGQHSAFASALTGKTPLWGLHLEENRRADIRIEVQAQPRTTQDWYLMGYHFGATLGQQIPVYTDLQPAHDLYSMIALSAAGMTTGSVAMYHIVGVTPEAPTLEAATGGRVLHDVVTYGEAERMQAYRRLNSSDNQAVDVIILGCPHYGLERMKGLAEKLEGKKISENVALYVTTLRSVKSIMDREGYSEAITRAGAVILEDSCGLVLNMVDPSMVVATDSAKMAHYVPGTTGVRRVWFGTTDECLDAAVSGRWKGVLV
jgi:predicted aconitase